MGNKKREAGAEGSEPRSIPGIGPRSRKGHEVAVTKREPLPPTTEKGSTYERVGRTENKSRRE